MNNACPPLPLLLPPVAPKVTEWFPMSVSPVWPGEYQVRDDDHEGEDFWLHRWTGHEWRVPKTGQGIVYNGPNTTWRGVQL